MTSRPHLILLPLLAVVLPVAAAGRAEHRPPALDDPSAALAERLEAIRQEHGVPALGAALLRDGKVEQIAVAGLIRAGGDEKAEAGDAWHIGSCTKAMTATLAARLVEQGKLSWDTTLAEALPDLAGEMHEAYKAVTLRQVLGHRGGIIGHEANMIAMPALWAIERDTTHASMPDRRTAAATLILKAPPPGEAGEFRYSNYGYLLAGAICERAGGASWEELMKREVFGPLGITTAGFGPPPRIEGHVKQGESFSPQKRDNPLVMGPGGTAHMSLADWAKFAAAHLGQVEGYLKPETLAVLHEPLEGASYAMGWGARRNGEGKIVQLSHAGSNTMWYAVVVVDIEKGQARLAATNCMGQAAVDAAIKALDEPRP